MKRFVISFILVFALTSHAYGMGWMGGGHHDNGSVVNTGGNAQSGTTGTTGNNNGGSNGINNGPNNSGSIATTGPAGNDNGGKNEGDHGINNSGFIITTSTSDGRDRDGHDCSYGQSGSNTTAVPEPLTVFLLGSGLVGLAVIRKRIR